MTKIEALKKTIENVERGKFKYRWTSVDSCNCGVVARTLLGGKSVWEAEYQSAPTSFIYDGVFSRDAAYCQTSGLPIPEVFRVLFDAGFTKEDLNELENLSNAQLLIKVGIVVDRTKKEHLLAYLKAWVEILEEQEPVQQPAEQKVIIKYVSVPEIIKEMEVIEN